MFKTEASQKSRKSRLFYFFLIFRLKVETCENKRKRFKNNNCERAKTRAVVSYDSLVVLYHQLFDLSRISPVIQTQIRNYQQFLSSVSHFLEEAKSCDYNPQWNPLIIKVIEELPSPPPSYEDIFNI